MESGNLFKNFVAIYDRTKIMSLILGSYKHSDSAEMPRTRERQHIAPGKQLRHGPLNKQWNKSCLAFERPSVPGHSRQTKHKYSCVLLSKAHLFPNARGSPNKHVVIPRFSDTSQTQELNLSQASPCVFGSYGQDMWKCKRQDNRKINSRRAPAG